MDSATTVVAASGDVVRFLLWLEERVYPVESLQPGR